MDDINGRTALDRRAETSEKLGYLTSKVEEIHTDLREHIQAEGGVASDLKGRIEVIERDHRSWRRSYNFAKAVIAGIGALLVIEWKTLAENVKRFFGG